MTTLIIFERIVDRKEIGVMHTDLGPSADWSEYRSLWGWLGQDGRVKERTIVCPAYRALTAETRLAYETDELEREEGIKWVRVA